MNYICLATTDKLKIPLNPPFTKGEILKKIAILLIAVSFFFPLISIAAAAEKGTEEELKERIELTNKKRDTPKEIERFEEGLKSYFFEIVEFDVIERAIKELSPGEALTEIVLVKLSRKSDKVIIEMRKNRKNWTEITKETGVNIKDLVAGVKDFQKMAGCE